MKQAAPARGKGAGGKTIRSVSQRGRRQTTKRPPTSKARRSTPVIASTPPVPLRCIRWANTQWKALEAHHQQQIRSLCLLILSLLLFASLTVCQTVPILSGINHFFLLFFGWSAYVLALGLITLAVAHLVEGIRRESFVRFSLIAGLLCIWLLLLIESALIVGPDHVGVLGELLVLPFLFLGWSLGADHVMVLGLLLIAIILTFRIRFGQVLMVANSIKSLFAGLAPSPNHSDFLEQRPQYSSVGLPNEDGEADVKEAEAQGQTLPLQDASPTPYGRSPNLPGIITNLPVGGFSPTEMEPLVQGPHVFPQNSVPAHPAQARAKQRSDIPQNTCWKRPSISLLKKPDTVKSQRAVQNPCELARIIQSTLRSFRIDAEVRAEDMSIGPTVVRFGIRPTGKPEMRKDEKTGKQEVVKDAANNIVYETRTRVRRIMAIQNDLALVLEAPTIRMEAPVPGRPYVGVEIPNKNSCLVTLREVVETSEYQKAQAQSKLTIGLGKDVAGQVRVGDLAQMPHLLIAGATGSGKSACLNSIIASLLLQATPDEVRLLMVDPKMVELSMYNGIPHLLSPVVIEVDKVVSLLKNAIAEMERRYRLFSDLGVRNLDGYRKLREAKLAQKDHSLGNLYAIVIIIDELADLMMAAAEEVEGMICRLAQLARATGIHLIVATQRPSVDVITGLIKANIPTRISFMVSSAVDSRTIIGMGGAEKLLGRGDMLYLEASAGRPERIQGAFLSDEEAQRLTDYWRRQCSTIAQPK